MKILLSIKPEFAEKIFTGEKKFEYRKAIFKQHVETIVLYVSKPVGKIMGEFKVKDILHGAPIDIWEQTKMKSGITEEFFDLYFSGRDAGYAIAIESVKKYKEPIDPYIIHESFTPHQSFRYLT